MIKVACLPYQSKSYIYFSSWFGIDDHGALSWISQCTAVPLLAVIAIPDRRGFIATAFQAALTQAINWIEDLISLRRSLYLTFSCHPQAD
jgi:hypothetical protein